MKISGDVETYIYALLISTLGQGEWQALSPQRFNKETVVGIEQEASWAAEPVWKFQGDDKRNYVHFPLKIFAVGRSKHYVFWVCVCNPSHSACNAHSPFHIVVLGLSSCTLFLHIIS
jgi:hypothetical protein